MFMTPAGFVILILLALLGLWLFVEIGSLPGKTAKKRSHPQAEAINVLGWVGLLFGGVGWAVALVWAYTKNVLTPVAQGAAPSAGQPSAEPAEAEEAR